MNRKRAEGESDIDAAINSGVRRFRPIILTGLTTFFVLSPMTIKQSVQARFPIPMAISLGYSILFTTAITPFLTPALYVVHQDIIKLFSASQNK